MKAISAIQRKALERDLPLDAIPSIARRWPGEIARKRFEALGEIEVATEALHSLFLKPSLLLQFL